VGQVDRDQAPGIDLAREDAALARELRALGAGARLVFVAGLPGTGKTLVVRELAAAACAAGRVVHLLQWDTLRPALEASPAGRPYPLVDGVTHIVIRKAAGVWARRAVAAWQAAHPDPRHLLIGEAPLIGGRLIELARRMDDGAEPALGAPSCRFVVPVPSRAVRAFIEAERDRRMARPAHPREREDAPSHVLRGLWAELADVARRLGLAGATPASAGTAPYDPAVYEAVYRHVLAHRHATTLPLTRVLPVAGVSAYDLPVEARELLPTDREAAASIRAVEAAYPDRATLASEIERWYRGP